MINNIISFVLNRFVILKVIEIKYEELLIKIFLTIWLEGRTVCV